jgi:hypothetical protein
VRILQFAGLVSSVFTLRLQTFFKRKEKGHCVNSGLILNLVAGAGFEPTTLSGFLRGYNAIFVARIRHISPRPQIYYFRAFFFPLRLRMECVLFGCQLVKCNE